ncbi:MAG: MGH1-like glycoside hydrolase domain-containing protein, partial [Acidimicrobiia bacterium]
MRDAERQRLESEGPRWKRWGPYLSERAWGTVREDYSEHGEAWEHFSHDQARARAYRWNEDGLAGICDDGQRLCFALALWNGSDPILKERIFGLTGNEGNHGEDAKEHWWYVDSTPTHSWMRWRYLYPQAEFPYADLVAENRRRGRLDPEYELVDTGILDGDRYWDVTVDYAKAGPDDLCIRVAVRNAGPEEATLDVLPTLWFRNTWSWGLDDRRPLLMAKDGVAVVAEHHDLGRMTLSAAGSPELLFCDNESNLSRLWGTAGPTPYPKDGINDHVVAGADTVNPDGTGTKAALRYHLTVAAGATTEVRLRLAPEGSETGKSWARTMTRRRQEADGFYAALTPERATADETMVMRQAFAGMLWGKQFFHYDVDRWLEGDPAGPPPPEGRSAGRNREWRHLNNADVVSMPDKWEYPWYAAWDLAFHCVALAHVDPAFAKEQLLLMCREWYMHPNGQLPAYEWAFGDVNPPVHAWAALKVFEIDARGVGGVPREGGPDYEFLERIFHKLLLNFTWWVNRKDAEGHNVFEGGFLGLDNIGPLDRSAALPVDGRLQQSDGTAWMGMFCLNLLEMSLLLAVHDEAYEDMATKFFEHFAYIASAIHECGLWDEDDGFYYDVLLTGSGERIPL